MRIYLCPVDGHRTVHPDDVGPLDHVTPVAELVDGTRACELDHDDFVADAIATATTVGEIRHKGGGWYELPNGESVHGKQAAIDALAALGVDDVDVHALTPAADSAGITTDNHEESNDG